MYNIYRQANDALKISNINYKNNMTKIHIIFFLDKIRHAKIFYITSFFEFFIKIYQFIQKI